MFAAGIFLAIALGSRGILWAALAAKFIAAQLLEDDFALLVALFALVEDLLDVLTFGRDFLVDVFFCGDAFFIAGMMPPSHSFRTLNSIVPSWSLC